MAEALAPASRLAVSAAEISGGERIVDVATGTGNAALLAAARGAATIGVDLEPALLALAARRADAAGVAVTWVEGDAAALPVGDGSADAVLSVFGVMYVPDHPAAARELVRVAAPGGRIVLAAWTPDSAMSAMGAVLADYLPPPPPPPPASGPPSRWGDAIELPGLLADAGASLTACESHDVVLSFADAREAATFLIRTAGHVLAHRDTLVSSGRWQALHDDLTTFAETRGEQGDGRLDLRLEYLLAVAVRT